MPNNQSMGEGEEKEQIVVPPSFRRKILEKAHADLFALEKNIRKAALVVNLVKSDFAKAEVTYLGHKVGRGKVAPKESNVISILNFPVPKNRKNIMQFLGLANYYRKFVSNFADVSTPLSNLLKKDVEFKWTPECQKAFSQLKHVLTSYPILLTPNFDKPFELAVDASDYGVGAVLTQTDEDGIEHPVAYYSKKLSVHQKKYSVVEKEGLALILALQHFEIYLTSNLGPLLVRTDHNPIKFIKQFSNKNRRLTRWSLFLQDYDLDIQHIRGRDNVVPDVLSRME